MARPSLFAPVRRAACAARRRARRWPAPPTAPRPRRAATTSGCWPASRRCGSTARGRRRGRSMRRVAAEAEAIARRHAAQRLRRQRAVAGGDRRARRATASTGSPPIAPAACEFLDTLVRRYPSSSLVAEARALLRRHARRRRWQASLARRAHRAASTDRPAPRARQPPAPAPVVPRRPRRARRLPPCRPRSTPDARRRRRSTGRARDAARACAAPRSATPSG